MPKHSRALTFPFQRTSPSVVVVPSRGGRVRRAAARMGGFARKAGRRAGRTAREHAVPAVAMAMGGAIAGALDAKGVFNKLPALGGSRAFTLAAVGYAATRFSKNRYVRSAGLAAIAVGAFDAVKSHMAKAAAPVKAPAVSGHDDGSGNPGDGGPY